MIAVVVEWSEETGLSTDPRRSAQCPRCRHPTENASIEIAFNRCSRHALSTFQRYEARGYQQSLYMGL